MNTSYTLSLEGYYFLSKIAAARINLSGIASQRFLRLVISKLAGFPIEDLVVVKSNMLRQRTRFVDIRCVWWKGGGCRRLQFVKRSALELGHGRKHGPPAPLKLISRVTV